MPEKVYVSPEIRVLKPDTLTEDRLSLKTARYIQKSIGDRLAKLNRISKLRKLTESDFAEALSKISGDIAKKLIELKEIKKDMYREKIKEVLRI